MLEEVEDGDRKVVIGRQQARAPGDNPVPVMVGIAGEGDLELILQADQPLHRIGRGWVHADLAVPIDCHETEGRIDGLVDDREVQPVALGNRPPVVDAGAAERIDPQADLRAANGLHVDHIAEISNVGVEVVVPVRCGGAQRLLVRNPVHAAQAAFEKLVRLRLDPVRDGWLRRPAVGWIVLEAAVMGRIVRRRDHDAVGKTCFSARGCTSESRGKRQGSGYIRPPPRA